MNHEPMSFSQHSATADWSLPTGDVLRLDIGPGVRELRVTQGRLWLTREGDAEAPAEDLWLAAGDALELASGSEWVIEGWGETRFQLLVPPRACATLARRLSASVRSSARPSARSRLSAWLSPALG